MHQPSPTTALWHRVRALFHNCPKRRRTLTRWFWINTILSGLLALLWLILRSGSKPSRLAYPCQRAALGTASAAVVVPFIAWVISECRAIVRSAASRPRRAILGLGIVTIVFATWSWSSARPPISSPPQQPRSGYRASVFVADDAADPTGQGFPALDDLLLWMGAHDLPFYASQTTRNFETSPQGIIGADDVVVIKINYQWGERGGTNVDLLRGLIRRICDHPDGFLGEIVVCENAQFVSIDFNRSNNNALDPGRSPHDVVTEFRGLGRRVSHYNWTARRNTSVGEYHTGDLNDGYVVYSYDPTLAGRVSYPKFRTADGTYVSLRNGIWDPSAGTYDRARLKFINVPVLKSHHASYGVTASVKNYMGVVTGALSTNSHSAIRYGILGELLGEIGLADLNILDCIWINADLYTGPATSYAGATRIDKLVAGTDPVAIDIWVTKHILIPAYSAATGFDPLVDPWPQPSANPDDPSSAFRIYLDNSMNRLILSGQDVTNDLARVDVFRWNGDLGIPGDINGDGTVDGRDIAPFVAAMLETGASPLQLLRADLDRNRQLDAADVTAMTAALLLS